MGKHFKKRKVLQVILVIVFSFFCTNKSYADTTNEKGLVTDANGFRWEYNLETTTTEVDEETQTEQTLFFSFYDKPADASTVTIPSLAEMIELTPNAVNSLNTYVLVDADIDAQDEAYASTSPRREATATTNKLDMSNAAKIQIKGVAPIIDPAVETELVFGEQIVISDSEQTVKAAKATVCGALKYNQSTDKYDCYYTYDKEFPIKNVRKMSSEQLAAWTPSLESIGCEDYHNATSLTYSDSKCYVTSSTVSWNQINKIGAFGYYKLKLTNFNANTFNYVGWYAFANSEINGQEVTISGDAFKGSNIFANSNLKKVTINTNTIGDGIFKGNEQLDEVTFGDNVDRITNAAFAGTGFTSIDFSQTNIKTIGAHAFEGAKLTSVNLEGINRIEYRAFKDNNISELYLPKSINYLQAELFKGNTNIHKLTIAYDTLTSGTTLPLYVVLDNTYNESVHPSSTIEEVEIIAPYSENETVSDTHITYSDYRFNYDAYTQKYNPDCPHYPTGCNSNYATYNSFGFDLHTPYNGTDNSYGSNDSGLTSRGWPTQFEDDYADVDSKKNILAPIYFANFHGLKKITIGEGYEFIGSSAFAEWESSTNGKSFGDNKGASGFVFRKDTTDKGNRLSLPSTLKGVGNHAFDHVFIDMVDFTIPRNIEFIGMGAFQNVYYYNKDVDFPNLVALGDFAFSKTQTRNIHLYNKLRYMGVQVFSDCVYLNDITFDFDVFNSDPSKVYVAWALPHRSSDSWYDGQFHFTTEFGPRVPNDGYSNYGLNETEAEQYGVRLNKHQVSSLYPLQFGTIKFTSNNKSQLPNGYNNCRYDRTGNCSGYGATEHNTFFGHINADKIDIGETDWKVLSPRMFVEATANEIILPHNLEVIPGDSFSDAIIQKELILPNTVQVIGDAAFNYGKMKDIISGANQKGFSVENDTVKITKLPNALTYVGNDAFYGDYNLTANLDSPNLRNVSYHAFMHTRLQDVNLPQTIQTLQEGAFVNIPTLRNITIDFDFGALQPNYWNFNSNDFPQSFRDYAGNNLLYMLTMSNLAYYMAYPTTGTSTRKIKTFYNLFSKTQISSANNSGQIQAHDSLGKIIFTKKAQTDISNISYTVGFFSGYEFDEVDLSKTGWKQITTQNFAFSETKIGTLKLPEDLKKIAFGAFYESEITNEFSWPSTLEDIGGSAFQQVKGTTSNALPEGLKTIGSAAFYATDLTDDLVIPSTVNSIGWSTFNAGNADVHYDTVTIKPDLTSSNSSGQLVHQLLWNTEVDKLIIESSKLVAYGSSNQASNQEFWHMPIKEVVITNLPTITEKAFDGCINLEKVDFSADENLSEIKNSAFTGDEKLHIINFSPKSKNKTITIGQYAFEGTAFETMGDAETDFDITAANFDATTGYAFYGMPKLRSANIPNTFSHATIPTATFANDTDLETVNVDYRTTDIKDDAFANDTKLARIFIWGNTVVEDTDLEEYTAPDFYGHGGEPNANREGDPALGLTIPETTDIYAYSVSPTEAYAGEPRDDLEGKFYPLDEVLYITTNDPKVQINEDNTDFDKSNIVTYAVRRDGIILQSDTWGEYDGDYYPRNQSDITFEHEAETVANNPSFGTIYDTPVPLSELNVGNINFQEIDFELIPDENNDNIRLINVIYTDGYTRGTPDTDIDPYSTGGNNPIIPDPIEDIIEDLIDGPITKDLGIALYVVTMTLATIATVIVIKKRNTR